MNLAIMSALIFFISCQPGVSLSFLNYSVKVRTTSFILHFVLGNHRFYCVRYLFIYLFFHLNNRLFFISPFLGQFVVICLCLQAAEQQVECDCHNINDIIQLTPKRFVVSSAL